jgi:hypothetical protein
MGLLVYLQWEFCLVDKPMIKGPVRTEQNVRIMPGTPRVERVYLLSATRLVNLRRI